MRTYSYTFGGRLRDPEGQIEGIMTAFAELNTTAFLTHQEHPFQRFSHEVRRPLANGSRHATKRSQTMMISTARCSLQQQQQQQTPCESRTSPILVPQTVGVWRGRRFGLGFTSTSNESWRGKALRTPSLSWSKPKRITCTTTVHTLAGRDVWRFDVCRLFVRGLSKIALYCCRSTLCFPIPVRQFRCGNMSDARLQMPCGVFVQSSFAAASIVQSCGIMR